MNHLYLNHLKTDLRKLIKALGFRKPGFWKQFSEVRTGQYGYPAPRGARFRESLVYEEGHAVTTT